MGYKKNTFLSEHYVHSCTSNLSLQFRNTSFDKLAFDRRERVGRIIRPALLQILLTATTDLINFIIVICKICRKIGLGHEMLMAETETRPRRWQFSSRRDRDETLVRLETVSRPRCRDRDHNPGVGHTDTKF